MGKRWTSRVKTIHTLSLQRHREGTMWDIYCLYFRDRWPWTTSFHWIDSTPAVTFLKLSIIAYQLVKYVVVLYTMRNKNGIPNSAFIYYTLHTKLSLFFCLLSITHDGFLSHSLAREWLIKRSMPLEKVVARISMLEYHELWRVSTESEWKWNACHTAVIY